MNTDVGTKCSRIVRDLFELIQQSSPGERAGEDLENEGVPRQKGWLGKTSEGVEFRKRSGGNELCCKTSFRCKGNGHLVIIVYKR